MKTMRISIAGLMGFVLVVALGFGGLKGANEYWASGCFTLMVTGLVVAILNAALGRGKDRAYWLGFAVAGGIYLAVAFGTGEWSRSAYPSLLPQLAFNRLEPLIHPNANFGSLATITVNSAPNVINYTTIAAPLAAAVGSTTSTTVDVIVDQPVSMPPTPPTPVATPLVGLPPAIFSPTATYSSLTPFITWPPSDMTRTYYSQVSHSLTALLAGMLGGLYAAWLVARRERRQAELADEVTPSSP
jgi:hypothetical protein